MLATGDNSGVADLGLGLGSLLISSNYSRGHESEADLYAFEKMLVTGIDPQAFSAIMQRMTDYIEEVEPKTEESPTKENAAENKDETNVLDYLSSHPNTKQRIERAKKFSECFHQGLVDCEVE
jgi:predicted Zn-dependent protease